MKVGVKKIEAKKRGSKNVVFFCSRVIFASKIFLLQPFFCSHVFLFPRFLFAQCKKCFFLLGNKRGIQKLSLDLVYVEATLAVTFETNFSLHEIFFSFRSTNVVPCFEWLQRLHSGIWSNFIWKEFYHDGWEGVRIQGNHPATH